MDIDAQHENAPPKAPTHHERLWFPGGDVILKTNTLLFKVHKDVLSLQSSVFKDMFDFPAVNGEQSGGDISGDTRETFEGLPMVYLVGDRAEDVVHLLRTVYERQ